MKLTNRIVVLGSSGLVGKALMGHYKLAESLGAELVGSHLRDGTRNVDCRRKNSVLEFLKVHRPFAVVIAAGLVRGVVGNSADTEFEMYHTNAEIASACLRACDEFFRSVDKPFPWEGHKSARGRVAYLGSVCAFPAQPKGAPVGIESSYLGDGSSRYEPSNFGYGEAKRFGTRFLNHLTAQPGCRFDGVTLVPGNLFGPGDHFTAPAEAQHFTARLFARHAAARLLRYGLSGRTCADSWITSFARPLCKEFGIEVTNNFDFVVPVHNAGAERSWVYAPHLAEGIIRVLCSPAGVSALSTVPGLQHTTLVNPGWVTQCEDGSDRVRYGTTLLRFADAVGRESKVRSAPIPSEAAGVPGGRGIQTLPEAFSAYSPAVTQGDFRDTLRAAVRTLAPKAAPGEDPETLAEHLVPQNPT